MKNKQKDYDELERFCSSIKNDILNLDSQSIDEVLKMSMKYPHAPQPQNLLGIIAELNHDCKLAIRHYKAALDFDSHYNPALKNLDRLSELEPSKDYCFNDEDNQNQEHNSHHILKRKLG